MKVRLLKVIRNKETKEETSVETEIDSDEVQCVYRDRNGVLISLKNGYLVKVDHSYQEMANTFIKDDSF